MQINTTLGNARHSWATYQAKDGEAGQGRARYDKRRARYDTIVPRGATCGREGSSRARQGKVRHCQVR